MGQINLIWMQSSNGIIGSTGQLPFHIPEDLARFKELTTKAVVIMGRKTWESLPDSVKPLPNRYNVILTRNKAYAPPETEHPYVEVIHDLEAFLRQNVNKDLWVIGGGDVYRQALQFASGIYITRVYSQAQGDTGAPFLDPALFRCVSQSSVKTSATGHSFHYEFWKRMRVIRWTKVKS